MFFTSAGASQGEIILAVNTLLMQLFTLFSYVMDGFASAMQELEYTRSLTEITRDRAYELAEEYYDVLSETE